MELDKLLVTLAGIILAGTTYWFFLNKKEQVSAASANQDIIVRGGYTPSVITIPANQPVKLNFTRKDPSSCLEEVVLPDLGIKEYLPLNQTITVELAAQPKGEYQISCGMNMFHAKLKVI